MSLPNPTLVAEFAKTKRLPSSLTFTRASAATYTDNNGYVQYAANNTARFDHTPSDGTSNGLLIEESRTNLLTYSSDFADSSWNKLQTSLISNCAVAPDGAYTADKLIESTTTSVQHYMRLPIASIAAGTYTFSVFCKAAVANRYLVLEIYNATDATSMVAFNPTTGSITFNWNSGTATGLTQAYPNGWYRVSITTTKTVTSSAYLYITNASNSVTAYTGDGTSGIYIWGAQLEAGAFPTSYIPSVETFTSRASTATYFDSTDGLLKVTPTNLLTYSQDFTNAAWGKTNILAFSSTGSLSNIAIAPDGTQTASKIVENSSAGVHGVSSGSVSITLGQSVTYSIYVKSGERTSVSLIAWIDGTHYVYMNPTELSTTVSTVGALNVSAGMYSGKSEDVGYGWKRLSLSFVSPVTTTTGFFELRIVSGTDSYTGNGISGLYIWGAQVNLGALQQYTVTTGTAVIDSSTSTFARPHYNPYSKQNNGILLEPSATNLLTYSEQFDNAIWSKTLCSVTANQTTAPDGTLTADAIVTTANAGGAYQSVTSTISTIYTASSFVKAGTITAVMMRDDTGAGRHIQVDLLSGTITGTSGTLVGYSCLAYPNGWYRISMSYAADTTTVRNWVRSDQAAGTFYVWGAQLETGTSATSYIPTIASQKPRAADTGSSTSATRAAETCYINVGSWFNQAEGTLYTTSQMNYASSHYPRVVEIDGVTDSTDRWPIFYLSGSTTTIKGDNVTNSVSTFTSGATITSGSSPTVALAYKANDSAMSVNGSTPTTDTSVTLMASAVKLSIGGSPGGNPLNGTIAKLYYFPKRLDNTTLRNLSGL